MRGSHHNRTNRYPEEMLDEVREHIRKFPVTESHYCRVNTKKNYLEEGLSMAKMYRLYVLQKKSQLQSTMNDTKDNSEANAQANDTVENEIDEESSENDDENTDDGENADGNKKEKESDVVEKPREEEKKNQSLKDVTDPTVVRLKKYTQIFNEEFNLGFFKPKKDRWVS